MKFDLSRTDSKLKFIREFVNRWDAYAIQMQQGYRKVDERITDELLLAHLSGRTSIGTYQLMDGKVSWACYDIDAHDDELNKRADDMCFSIMCRLYELEIPFFFERSGTPHSYHLWIFLVPVDVTKAHYYFRDIVKDMDVDCEIYPKQRTDDPMKPYGNLVKLPLGCNEKNGNWSTTDSREQEIIRYDIRDYEPDLSFEYSASSVEARHDAQGREISNGMGVELKSFPRLSVMPLNIRPCLSRASRMSLTGTSGHVMRCALVPELKQCQRMSFEEVVMFFGSQGDFSPDRTREQVQSLWKYNRYSCAYLYNNARSYVDCDNCEWIG